MLVVWDNQNTGNVLWKEPGLIKGSDQVSKTHETMVAGRLVGTDTHTHLQEFKTNTNKPESLICPYSQTGGKHFIIPNVFVTSCKTKEIIFW